MKPRSIHSLHRFIVLLLIFLPLYTIPVQATTSNFEPGEDLGHGSGLLNAGNTYQITLVGPGPANIRLEVKNGTATDTIKMTLQNSTGTKSWTVRSGEIAWVYADLPAGSSLLALNNRSNTALSFQLNAYARGVVGNIADGAATWSGTARGTGIQSVIQLDILTAGTYRFTLGAKSGSFQLKVDDNYIRKTVISGSAPVPNDSVYYLKAGAHTFTIEQDPTGTITEWSLLLAAAGTNDILPSTESSARLGGGSFFSVEHIPLHVETNQPVNLRIAATGSAGDSLVVELYNESKKVFTSVRVFGGEVAWGSSALVAGANALRIVAGGNNAALTYTVQVSPLGQPPFTWAGKSYGANGDNSSIRLTFPEAGLYKFTFGAAKGGRYQMRLSTNYLQKTVTDAGASFTAFVPQGTYPLVIDQDSQTSSTSWSVAIAPTTSISDQLLYRRSGSTLGGTNNDFDTEWLPLQVTADEVVNLRIAASGNARDSLRVYLYNASTQVYSATTIYGGEVFWATSGLKEGTNRLRIAANSSNTTPMTYQIDVKSVEDIPNTWQGVAHGNGLNSTIHVNVPMDGIYTLALTMTEGLGLVLVDAVPPTTRGAGLTNVNTVQRWPLTAGFHTFTFKQDPSASNTAWQISMGLRRSSSNLIYLPLIRR